MVEPAEVGWQQERRMVEGQTSNVATAEFAIAQPALESSGMQWLTLAH